MMKFCFSFFFFNKRKCNFNLVHPSSHIQYPDDKFDNFYFFTSNVIPMNILAYAFQYEPYENVKINYLWSI